MCKFGLLGDLAISRTVQRKVVSFILRAGYCRVNLLRGQFGVLPGKFKLDKFTSYYLAIALVPNSRYSFPSAHSGQSYQDGLVR